MSISIQEPNQRSVVGLDLSPEHSGIFTPGLENIHFSTPHLDRFNTLALQLNDQMQPLTQDQIAGVARRVLRTHASGGESPFIRSRMRRAAEMRALRDDPAWQPAADLAQSLEALLAYLDDPDSLFHNSLPVIGLLDDALLVDIAMDRLREELSEYADFRRHLHCEAARLGVDVSELVLDRAQWQTEREDEARLEHHLRRTRGARYGASSVMDRVFRVC